MNIDKRYLKEEIIPLLLSDPEIRMYILKLLLKGIKGGSGLMRFLYNLSPFDEAIDFLKSKEKGRSKKKDQEITLSEILNSGLDKSTLSDDPKTELNGYDTFNYLYQNRVKTEPDYYDDVEVTVYSHSLKDPFAKNDANTRHMIGNTNNLLRQGSLAISSSLRNALQMIKGGSLETGDKIYYRGELVGYYDDHSPQRTKNLDIYFFNPTKYRERRCFVTLEGFEVMGNVGRITWSEQAYQEQLDRLNNV